MFSAYNSHFIIFVVMFEQMTLFPYSVYNPYSVYINKAEVFSTVTRK